MSDAAQQAEYTRQSGLIRALIMSMGERVPSKRVRLIETHISWVILSGTYAYKIKKAIDLGFLNFSGLETRLFYCEEEIRLNSRLAPQIYLDVVPIGGSSEQPSLKGLPVLEYAVRMRQFPVSRQLDRLLLRNKLLPQHIDKLAETIANFHRTLLSPEVGSDYGNTEGINRDCEQNFENLNLFLKKATDLTVLADLHRDYQRTFANLSAAFKKRQLEGYVRECHGDLHLGNIVLMNEQPVPFDGIEFNPALRWIDVMSEVAFTVMDLLHHGRGDFAYRFLNAYLEITGDYAGVKLLCFYIAYRAMVRAKVNAIRASQTDLQPRETARVWKDCRSYLALATDYQIRKKPILIITYGLPGSGKSTFARIASERLQAIRLRSDVERKRLFGLAAQADSRVSIDVDLYSKDISLRTYTRLYQLAGELLTAGVTVIVDAAFLKREERLHFQQLAAAHAAEFVIASVYADNKTLRKRIQKRTQENSDASEADVAVLKKLQQSYEPLSREELDRAVDFCNEGDGVSADAAGWERLSQLIN